MGYFENSLQQVEKWVPEKTETSNFTYGITENNQRDLESLLAVVTGVEVEKIHAYCQELQMDSALRAHLKSYFLEEEMSDSIVEYRRKIGWSSLRAHFKSNFLEKEMSDSIVEYGRRIGWFALVRALKPRLVVESGVSDGVGACVISAALQLNANEGHPGSYVGTEINPKMGKLFTAPYSNLGKILWGDSIESLEEIKEPIDIFINDSDHSAQYELDEYTAISRKISSNGFILSDNSHTNTVLNQFSRDHRRSFVFFRELPLNHWYPGAGIGLSFPRR
jgi:hypothetical protein